LSSEREQQHPKGSVVAVIWDADGPMAADEPLARPFLTAPSGGPPPLPDPGGEVRPYLLTGGRTHRRGDLVAMETVVLATGRRPVRTGDAAGVERARIVYLAQRPCSAAELAAWLCLPLQVVLVLVGDLVTDGLLDATGVATGQSDDVLFLERLIAGVAAL
jgi:hypothetical protein